MRISTLFAAITLLLGAIVFLDVSRYTIAAVKNLEKVQLLRDLSTVRGQWFNALAKVSLERSLSQVQLSMERGTDGEIAAMRAEQVKLSRKSFAEIGQLIAALDGYTMRDEVIEDMNLALAEIDAAHAKIDQLLTLPLAQRDAAEMAAQVDLIKREITLMKGMAVHFVAENELTSTQAMLLARLQENVFDVRENAGRARSFYVIATLQGTPLTPPHQEYVRNTLALSKDHLEGIEHITETIPVPDSVLQGIDTLQKDFGGVFFPMLENLDSQMDLALQNYASPDQVLSENDSVTVDYDISFEDFFARSSAALAIPATLFQKISTELDLIWEARAVAQRNTLIFQIATLIAVIAIFSASLWLVATKITGKLQKSMADLAALTEGQLDRDLTPAKNDLVEIKMLANGLSNLQDQLKAAEAAREALKANEAAQKHIVARLSDGLRDLASGTLTTRLDDQFDPSYQSLADDFNSASAALSQVVTRVMDTSHSVFSGTRGISEATSNLSSRTEAQGATLQNAAAALEQLTRNIENSRADATELDKLAKEASANGAAMVTTMGQTVAAIEKIKVSSHEIEQIVGLIEDIAFQTNLLALNAGVEATRAGAQGSGFGVIAQEVRNLAERTAKSAQDIKSLIVASGVEVSKGVEFVSNAETSVGAIGEHIETISELISRIAVAAAEQSQGLSKVNEGVSQLDLVTQTNVAMVEETTAECVSLAQTATELTQIIARFDIGRGHGEALARQDRAA